MFVRAFPIQKYIYIIFLDGFYESRDLENLPKFIKKNRENYVFL